MTIADVLELYRQRVPAAKIAAACLMVAVQRLYDFLKGKKSD